MKILLFYIFLPIIYNNYILLLLTIIYITKEYRLLIYVPYTNSKPHYRPNYPLTEKNNSSIQ